MAKARKKKKGKAKGVTAKTKEQTFVCTDNEVDLLLKLTHKYK